MARLPGGFDANEAEEMQSGFKHIDGIVNVKMTDSDYLKNAKENGHYLKCVFTIQNGKHEGKEIWRFLNLDNPNATTVDIAQREFAAIQRACGVMNPEDSEELHGIEIQMDLYTRKGKEKPDGTKAPDSQEVRNYMSIEGVATPTKPTETSEDKPKARKKLAFEDDDD